MYDVRVDMYLASHTLKTEFNKCYKVYLCQLNQAEYTLIFFVHYQIMFFIAHLVQLRMELYFILTIV